MERSSWSESVLERLQIRRQRHLGRSRFYRVPFALAGFTVVLLGIAMLVLPGPGLLVMAAGLGMLALEFAWAERVLEQTLQRMDRTGQAVKRAHWTLQGLSVLAGLLGIAALVAVAMYFDFPLVPF